MWWRKFYMEFLCPKCSAVMERVEYEGLSLLRCPNGDGHWISGSKLAEIVKKEEEKIPKKYFDEVSKSGRQITDQRGVVLDVKCPQCGAMCKKINYSYSSGIIIDHCPNGCGIWLDAGELEKVQAFYEFWNRNAEQYFVKSGAAEKTEEIEMDFENSEKKATSGIGGFLGSLYSRFFNR